MSTNWVQAHPLPTTETGNKNVPWQDGSDREVKQVNQKGRNNSQRNLFFTDLDELLSEHEQHQSTNGIVVTDSLTIPLENAVQALQNICHFVSH